MQKAGLDVHDIFRAKRSADVLGYKFPQPTRVAVERANGYHAVDQSRRRIGGRAMELVNGDEFFSLALSNSGALSILDANFKVARASGEPWSTVRLEQRVFGENSMSSPR